MMSSSTNSETDSDASAKPVEQKPLEIGGLEGPNSMYVKLISSDNHEFIIKREYAYYSGTIRAMLSGPGKRFDRMMFFFCLQFY